jgi:hypothetical protein
MNTRTRWRLPVLALALALAASGCRRSGLVTVTGKLTYRGRPVPSTYVTFQPEEEDKRASHGLTDDDGNFMLTYDRSEVGVLRGRHTVFLRYRVSAEEEMEQAPPKASPELRAVIFKYRNPHTSPLHYDVTRNGQFIAINLE